jgi:hypothetical protein
VFQTQIAEAIRATVLAGHGVGRLQVIGHSNMKEGLEVRVYRSTTLQSPVIDLLWDQIFVRLLN